MEKKGIGGTITSDAEGNISGLPDIANISEIEPNIKNLMEKYTYPMDIYYISRGYVQFRIYIESARVDIIYSEAETFETSPGRIAPHWLKHIIRWNTINRLD